MRWERSPGNRTEPAQLGPSRLPVLHVRITGALRSHHLRRPPARPPALPATSWLAMACGNRKRRMATTTNHRQIQNCPGFRRCRRKGNGPRAYSGALCPNDNQPHADKKSRRRRTLIAQTFGNAFSSSPPSPLKTMGFSIFLSIICFGCCGHTLP